MNSSLWFYSDTRQTYGPVAVHQLTAMIQAGQLTAGHFIMPEGGHEWQVLASSPFAAYLPTSVADPQVADVSMKPAASPTRQGAPPARTVGKPYQRPAQAPQPAAKKTGSYVSLIAIVAILVILAGVGWWFIRPAPVVAEAAAEKPKPNLQSAPAPIEIRPSKTLGPKLYIEFVNQLSENVDFEWVDFEGKHSRWGTVKAGEKSGLTTYVGHTWLITSSLGKYLGLVEAAGARSTVFIDQAGVRLQAEAALPAPTPKSQPVAARGSAFRRFKDDGEPSRLRFLNKREDEIKIERLDIKSRLRETRKIKPGHVNDLRTAIGEVWLFTAQDGGRIGHVQSATERGIVTISSQGVELKPEAVPDARSLLLVSDVQFTGATIGDVVSLLRRRAAEAGLAVQIELDSKADPKAGSVNLDAAVIPLSEAVSIGAYNAGLRMKQNGSHFRIEPR